MNVGYAKELPVKKFEFDGKTYYFSKDFGIWIHESLVTIEKVNEHEFLSVKFPLMAELNHYNNTYALIPSNKYIVHYIYAVGYNPHIIPVEQYRAYYVINGKLEEGIESEDGDITVIYNINRDDDDTEDVLLIVPATETKVKIKVWDDYAKSGDVWNLAGVKQRVNSDEYNKDYKKYEDEIKQYNLTNPDYYVALIYEDGKTEYLPVDNIVIDKALKLEVNQE